MFVSLSLDDMLDWSLMNSVELLSLLFSWALFLLLLVRPNSFGTTGSITCTIMSDEYFY